MAMTKSKAAAVTEEPEVDADAEEPATKGEVREMISGALDQIKSLLTGKGEQGGAGEPEGEGAAAPETNDELPSPRRVELDTERSVREALGNITINVNERELKAEKKEPEEAPGGRSWLTRFVGLNN